MPSSSLFSSENGCFPAGWCSPYTCFASAEASTCSEPSRFRLSFLLLSLGLRDGQRPKRGHPPTLGVR
jgi:hypothetical protein